LAFRDSSQKTIGRHQKPLQRSGPSLGLTQSEFPKKRFWPIRWWWWSWGWRFDSAEL